MVKKKRKGTICIVFKSGKELNIIFIAIRVNSVILFLWRAKAVKEIVFFKVTVTL